MAPAPETPERGMSSRLLTMKFMQRAAASASASATATATATPSSDERSSKRRRVGDSSPSLTVVDQAAAQAALQEKEATRQAAFSKHSAELVDTHWVLDMPMPPPSRLAAKPRLHVQYVGYADIDATNGPGSAPAATVNGRTKTGNYKKEEAEEPSHSDDEDEGDDNGDDGSDDGSAANSPGRSRSATRASPSTADSAARARLKKRKRERDESVEARKLREKRRKKEVNLNKLTSISGSGGGSPRAGNSLCFKCKQPGHKAANCPKSGGGPSGGSQRSSNRPG